MNKLETISYLEKFDIIILAETFIEERTIERAQQHLPLTHHWSWSPAIREKKKEMGVRNTYTRHREWIVKDKHVIAQEVDILGETHMIVGVYNRSGLKLIKNDLNILLEHHPERNIIIGDWNARIGTLADRVNPSDNRNTKDVTINEEGKRWVDLLQSHGLEILNGNIDGDWAGEYTHVGYKGSSVIDYAATSPLIAAGV